MSTYSVYIHTNKINGKRYIGTTKRKPEKRWRNGEGYKDQPHFYSAIQKYGWDNFDHFILEVDSEELMYQLEQQYIAYYKTTDRRYGYNKSVGGSSGAYLGRCVTREEKLKYHKDYYRSHREKFVSYVREHKDEINAKRRERYKNSEEKREKVRQKGIEYREKNKDLVRLRKKEYYERNKEIIKEKAREYHRTHKYQDIPPITPLW